jgi:hypothetical protein
MAPFETVEDAAGAYGLEPGRFLAELRQTAALDARHERPSMCRPKEGGTP